MCGVHYQNCLRARSGLRRKPIGENTKILHFSPTVPLLYIYIYILLLSSLLLLLLSLFFFLLLLVVVVVVFLAKSSSIRELYNSGLRRKAIALALTCAPFLTRRSRMLRCGYIRTLFTHSHIHSYIPMAAYTAL